MNATRPAARAPSPSPDLKSQARDVLRQSWHAFHPLPALYCTPALAIALVGALGLGQPGPAILGAAGAFSAGFGAFQRVTRFHVAPMILAALCMSVSTAIGTWASQTPWLDALVVAAAACSLGLAASFGAGPWWVLLQGAIFLVISGSQPGDLHEGLARALFVLGGGLFQSLVVAILRRLAPRGFPPLSGPNAAPPPVADAEWLAEARRVLRPVSPEMRYALLLGAAAGAAVLIARGLALPNGYWAAMTVLLVLRRGGTETVNRGVQRIGGTLIGAGLATLIAALLRPEPPVLVVLITAAAWCAYATQWVNYGTFSISVTSYVAFLLALEGLPEAAVAGHRVTATLLGGGIGVAALAVARLGRHAVRLSG
jgi:hypothetical protein